MSLGAQLPIRIEPDIQERLEVIAQEIGTSKSALIRLLVRTFVDQAVDPNGEVHLPPNWNDILRRLPLADGRSTPASPSPPSQRPRSVSRQRPRR